MLNSSFPYPFLVLFTLPPEYKQSIVAETEAREVLELVFESKVDGRPFVVVHEVLIDMVQLTKVLMVTA